MAKIWSNTMKDSNGKSVESQLIRPVTTDNLMLPKITPSTVQYSSWEKYLDSLSFSKEKQAYGKTAYQNGTPVGVRKNQSDTGNSFIGFTFANNQAKSNTDYSKNLPTTKSGMQNLRKQIESQLSTTPLSSIETTETRSDAKTLFDAFHTPKDGHATGTYEHPKQMDRAIHRILNIRSNYSVEEEEDYSLHQFFDRYYSIYPDYELTNLCQYTFITRPDLNIVTKKNGSGFGLVEGTDLGPGADVWPTAIGMWSQHPWLLKALSKEMTSVHDFIPFMTSRIETSQLPDYSIKNYSVNQPYTGYLLPYGSHGISSTTGASFDITFRETNDLCIHKLYQIWLEYIDRVTRNLITPKERYILENRADYMVSIYNIICAPDAKTILYWNKYTGCFPIVNPNSTLSFNRNERGADNKVNITFNYFHSEPLNPQSLIDFNRNCKVLTPDGFEKLNEVHHVEEYYFSNVPVPSYGTGYAFATKPFIKINKKGFYELGWVRRTRTNL